MHVCASFAVVLFLVVSFNPMVLLLFQNIPVVLNCVRFFFESDCFMIVFY